ncbi:MAG: hypothetical protein AVDCRST_MAG18-1633 [uncultured Thermomicrobiales bacterium]|uniref:Uncharacterized protein n=1 Tax=uncultured Thermomicrobiales bacterium TaxID=1645740 RepID=A0A6J4V6D9_9BACT|nr:MAG: hypothetical protein AVDCRST_MAG18-1633 [uncultured Thermomicrobiales bacterium]
MNGRTNWLVAVVAILGALLLTCVAVTIFGVVAFILSGEATVPYNELPPTPSVRP